MRWINKESVFFALGAGITGAMWWFGPWHTSLPITILWLAFIQHHRILLGHQATLTAMAQRNVLVDLVDVVRKAEAKKPDDHQGD